MLRYQEAVLHPLEQGDKQPADEAIEDYLSLHGSSRSELDCTAVRRCRGATQTRLTGKPGAWDTLRSAHYRAEAEWAEEARARRDSVEGVRATPRSVKMAAM